MPVYRVQVADGRVVRVQGNDPDSASRSASEWARANPGPAASHGPTLGSMVSQFAGGVGDFVNQSLGALSKGPNDQIGGEGDQAAALGDVLRPGNAFRRAAVSARTAAQPNPQIPSVAPPQNFPERVSRTAGSFLPNAFGGEATLPARVVRVVAPAAASVIAKSVAGAAGAGPIGQAAASTLGAAVGGGTAGLADAPQEAAAVPRSVTSLTPVEQSAVGKFARAVKPDLNVVTGKAAAYSQAGIPPTLVDTTGDAGQGVTRALASKPTPARDAVKAFARTRALSLPDRMADQARNIVSSDPRSVDQISDEINAARIAHNQQAMAPIRGDTIAITPGMEAALTSDAGQKAIVRAGQRQIDPEARSDFSELSARLAAGNSVVGTPITVGQAHDISQALFDRADSATDMGDQRALKAFGAIVRDGAKDQHDPYATVMAQGETAHRLAEAPALGAKGLKADRNAFSADMDAVNQIPALPDAEGAFGPPNGNALARAGFARAIENASGDPRTSSAIGTAYKIADTPGQQVRNAAILGPDDATTLQNNMRLEADAVENARNANPRAGSNTFLNAEDNKAANNLGNAGTALAGAASMAHGPLGLVSAAITGAKLYLATRGFSDAEAEAMANMAIDPAKHDDVVSYIASRAGPQAAQTFSSQIQQAAGSMASAATSPAALIPATTAAANAFGPQSQPPPGAGP